MNQKSCNLADQVERLTAELDLARKQVTVVQAALDSTDVARNKFLDERDAALRKLAIHESPVSDEEWGKGRHLANRSDVNDIIINRSKPPEVK